MSGCARSMFARAVVPHLRAPMSRSDGSKPPAVEQDAFALQSVAWEEAIKRASRPPRVNNDIAVHATALLLPAQNTNTLHLVCVSVCESQKNPTRFAERTGTGMRNWVCDGTNTQSDTISNRI